MTFFELLEKGLGQRINQNLQGFFRDKEILLIFDDFDLFYTEQIEFPSFIFSTLKRSKVKVIVTCTKPELKGMIEDTQKESWQKFKEDEYVGTNYDLSPLENEHLAHLVISLTESNIDGVSEQDILNHPKLTRIQGIPKALIRTLYQNHDHKKFVFKDKPLEINPYLRQYLDLDKRYGQIIESGLDPISRENALPNISRLSKNFSLYLKQLSQRDKMPISLTSPSVDGAGQLRFTFDSNKGANSLQDLSVSQSLPLPVEVNEEGSQSETKEVDNETETHEEDNGSYLLGIPTESSNISSRRESIEIEEEKKADV